MGWRETTLTIPLNGTDSPVLDLAENGARRAFVMTIIGPAALTGTVKIYVAKRTTDTFVILQSGGTDITLPAVKATPLGVTTFGAMKLVSSGAEAAARVFDIVGVAVK